MRFDQLNEANPETLAVGCPFCMTQKDKMIRETWGWMHYAFYVGFLGLFIGTTIIFFNDGIAEAGRIFRFSLLPGA